MISARSYLAARPVRSGPILAVPLPAAAWHRPQPTPLASKKIASPLRGSPSWASAYWRRSSSALATGVRPPARGETLAIWSPKHQGPIPCRQTTRMRFRPLARSNRATSDPGRRRGPRNWCTGRSAVRSRSRSTYRWTPSTRSRGPRDRPQPRCKRRPPGRENRRRRIQTRPDRRPRS